MRQSAPLSAATLGETWVDKLFNLALDRFIEETDFDARDYLTAEEVAQWDAAQLEELSAGVDGPKYAGKVVIEVLDGVAEVTAKPDNIEVEIVDHDNEEPSRKT
jgi:hypothetical protein